MTTPKLPPPPRSPQKRSAFSSALARTVCPSAVTTSAASRLSQVRPYLRISQPMPPPSVRPAMPVWEICPPVTARPWAWVACVQLAPEDTGLGAHGALLRVHFDALHRRQVDHHPAVVDRVAGQAVAAAAHGNEQVVFAGVGDGRHHIRRGFATGDHCRPPVDHAVPDLARLIVAGVAIPQQTAVQMRL